MTREYEPARTKAGATTLSSFAPARSGLLQRKCACGGTPGPYEECAECRKKRLGLQRFATNRAEPLSVPSIVHDALSSPGQPLDATARAFMEPRFGHDFGQVRVHTDAPAAESARAVNALAYTVGHDIVFGAGQYAPETSVGRRLMAHELVHVIQQRGSKQRAQRDIALDRPSDLAEAEADAVAQHVTVGLPPPAITPLSAMTLQRQATEEVQVGPSIEEPMTREEEIERSRTSPGEVTGSLSPLMFSLYNFAINKADLKERHEEALGELGDLIRRVKSNDLVVTALGHADSSGEPKINDPLSRRRAEAVQKVLERLAGTSVRATGVGESQPATTNATVEGRSRNRRVEIFLLPIPRPEPPQPKPPPPLPPGKEEPPPPLPPGKEEPPPPPPTVDGLPPQETAAGEKSFCEEYPILCAALAKGGGALAGGGLAVGGLFELLILAGLGGGLWALKKLLEGRPEDEEEPKEKPDKPPEPQACPIYTDLAGSTNTSPPGKRLEARLVPGDEEDTYSLEREFEMIVAFRGDTIPCACHCGEYKQEVRGYFEESDDRGNMERSGKRLYKEYLDEDEYREDGTYYVAEYIPYGHRSYPFYNTTDDQFLPIRHIGCLYKGKDAPGRANFARGRTIRVHLEFRGAPVDGCHGREPISGWPWIYWYVEGIYSPPGPPSRPVKPPPTSMMPLPTPSAGPQFTPVPTPYDSVTVNGVEIGRDTQDFLEHWESPDRDIYLPKVFEGHGVRARLGGRLDRDRHLS